MNNAIMKIVFDAQDKTQKAFNTLNRNIEKNKDSFKKLSQIGAVSMTAIGFSMKSVIDKSVDFESAFTGVRKTMDATEEQFKALDKSFMDMSKKIPITYQELAKIGELGGQLGVGVKDIKKFTETVAMISETTNLTSEQASMDFAKISNIMGEPIGNMDKMASSLVSLGNNFATTERDIINFTNEIAGSGKLAGMTVPDLMAISTAMSSVGIQAEAGGTAVSKAILKMNTSVASFNVSGSISADLYRFAEASGKTVNEFVDDWGKKPADAFNDFVTGIEKAGDRGVTVLQDVLGKDIRATKAFLSLAGAGDLLTRSLERGSDAWEKNTALTKEAELRFATTESQIKMLNNASDDMKRLIGDSLRPVLLELIKTIQPVINSIAEWVSKHPELTKNILLGATAVSGLALTFGTLGLVLPKILSGMMLLSTPFVATLTFIGNLTIAIVTKLIPTLIRMSYSFVVNFVKMSVTAGYHLARITTLFILNSTKWLISMATTTIKIIAQWVVMGAQSLIQAGRMALAWIIAMGPIAWVIATVVAVAGVIYANWDAIKSKTLEVWGSLSLFFSETWENIKGKFTFYVTGIKNFIFSIWENIKTKTFLIWNTIKNIFDTIFGYIKNILNSFAGFVGTVFDAVIGGIVSKVTGLIETLKKAWKWMKKVTNSAGETVSNAWSNVKSGASNAYSNTKKFVSSFAMGGVVNAPVGQPKMILAHGGEEIIPYHKRGNRGNNNISINMNGGIFADESVADKIGNIIIERIKTEITL